MPDRSVGIGEVIAEANAAFVDAVRRADADAVAAGYTVDAVVSPADAPDVAGRDAIRDMWVHIFGHGVDEARVDTTEVHVVDGMAVEVGILSADAGGTNAFVERFHAVWLEGADGWRIHRQIWNVAY
jgi:ketosteroid isomerase-like protein